MMDQQPWSEIEWARCAIASAARAIRRGRHLTFQEKNENLALAFEQEGDFEIATKIRKMNGTHKPEMQTTDKP
jgi:hypothetical protein